MAKPKIDKSTSKATLKKEMPKTAEEDEAFFDVLTDMLKLENELKVAIGPLQKKLLTHSRRLYTDSDKVLKTLSKDKKANKLEIAWIAEIRKYAYNLGKLMKSTQVQY